MVRVGSTVHVKDEKTGKSRQVHDRRVRRGQPVRAQALQRVPVGKALLGHKRNETVEVPVPRGPQRKLKITKIEV